MSENPAAFATTFTEWWTASNLPLTHEAAARAAWDAGVRAAVITLNNEMERLLDRTSYEDAALVRDLRAKCEHLFCSPDTWDHIKQMEHNIRVRTLADLRKKATEELQKWLTFEHKGSPWSQDIRRVLKERGIDAD